MSNQQIMAKMVQMIGIIAGVLMSRRTKMEGIEGSDHGSVGIDVGIMAETHLWK